MLALMRKELRTYFRTPTGWIFMAVFLLLSGLMFTLQLVFPQSPEYATYLAGLLFLFVIVVPLLTMRIFTDEKRFRTDQLLLTGPASLWSIVLGKFLAALAVFLITTAVTFLYPILLSLHGRLDWPVIIGTYAGFILIGGAFIAIGVYVSESVDGVVGAAILTLSAILVTFFIDFLQPYMPATELAGLVWVAILAGIALARLYSAGRNWAVTGIVAAAIGAVLVVLWFVSRDLFSGLIGESLSWLSLTGRFGTFAMGVLSLDAILYYLSFSAFFLFLTVQSLEKRRWS